MFAEVSGILGAVVKTMVSEDISAVVVTDGDKHIGMLTRSDILRTWMEKSAADKKPVLVRDVMTRRLISATTEDDVAPVVQTMEKAGIGHLPVYDRQELVAVLPLTEILSHQVVALTDENRVLGQYIHDLRDAIHD